MIKDQIAEKLDAKIGTETQVFWTRLRDKLEADITAGKREIEINQHVIAFAEAKIKEEKQKFK